jgi:hypothetical protein
MTSSNTHEAPDMAPRRGRGVRDGVNGLPSGFGPAVPVPRSRRRSDPRPPSTTPTALTTGRQGDAPSMSRSEPEREHREFMALTHTLTKELTRGDFGDRVLAEHMLRILGATSHILAQHPVDELGQCRACRHSSVWPRRRVPCTIHDIFRHFLKGRARFLDMRSPDLMLHQQEGRHTR